MNKCPKEYITLGVVVKTHQCTVSLSEHHPQMSLL